VSAPNPGDLRDRAARAVAPEAIRAGGRSVWGQRQHGGSLGAAVAGRRSCPRPARWGRSALAPGRAPRGGIGAGRQAATLRAVRWRKVIGSASADESVAVSEDTEDHAFANACLFYILRSIVIGLAADYVFYTTTRLASWPPAAVGCSQMITSCSEFADRLPNENARVRDGVGDKCSE
jgi:hypothetical protein